MKYAKGTFIVVPNQPSVLTVSAPAQALYMHLCFYANQDGECFPSRATLAKNLNVSVRSVDEYLKELEDVTLVIKQSRFNDNEQTTNVYHLPLFEGGAKSARGGVESALPPVQNLRTELNPILTQSIEQGESEIRIVSSSEGESDKQPRMPKDTLEKYNSLMKWSEEERGFPFMKGSHTKQFKAFAIAKDNGLKISQLKERFTEMLEDKFWSEKGFDWINVVTSFNKKQ